MSVFWQFTCFDYDNFLSLRKDLRAAESPEDFAALSANSMTDAIVASLAAGEMKAAVARNAFVQALCCTGEPLLLDAGLLRIVAKMAHTRGVEDLGEQLEAFLGGGMNLETWFQPGEALAGFLTPEQTRELGMRYGDTMRRGGTGRGRRRRQGGLVGKTGAFVRQLFAMEARPEESLRLLGELISEAAGAGQGIAVTTG